MDKNISFNLKVWRQRGPKEKGAFETYQMKDIPGDTSFLEMLDILNEQLVNEGKEPIVFEDYCQTFSVQQGAIYMDKNEDLSDVSAEEKRFEYLSKKLMKEEVPKGYESLEMVEKEILAVIEILTLRIIRVVSFPENEFAFAVPKTVVLGHLFHIVRSHEIILVTTSDLSDSRNVG